MSWEPFVLAPPDEKAPFPKPMSHREGLGDRLRIAAFAELQAVRAFGWATENFADVSPKVIEGWQLQIPEEKFHFRLIMERMAHLGVHAHQKPVSASLSESLYACQTGREFAVKIATAEHKGRLAALKMAAYLENRDPVTAQVFLRIAHDELAHVQLVIDNFNWQPE